MADDKGKFEEDSKLQDIYSAFYSHLGKPWIKKFQNMINGHIPANAMPIIDLVWTLLKKSPEKDDGINTEDVIITAIRILSSISSHDNIVSLLVHSFFQYIFHILKTNNALETEKLEETIEDEIAGLNERLIWIVNFINHIDLQEHVDEQTLQALISSVDIHVGIKEIGSLKNRIKRHRFGAKDDLEKCLKYLTLLVRIYTLRHALLFRMITCLTEKDYSRSTRCALRSYIEKERDEAREFLIFFSLTSLENACILAMFDPLEHRELETFLDEMGLLPQNLSQQLHEKIFLIKSIENPKVILCKPFFFFQVVRGNEYSTSKENVKMRFKFTAVENSFNVFHIQSTDSEEFLYMTENTDCKFAKKYDTLKTAQWRVIYIHGKTTHRDVLSTFVFCTRKWPEKLLYMDESLNVHGIKDKGKPTIGCLFTVSSYIRL